MPRGTLALSSVVAVLTLCLYAEVLVYLVSRYIWYIWFTTIVLKHLVKWCLIIPNEY